MATDNSRQNIDPETVDLAAERARILQTTESEIVDVDVAERLVGHYDEAALRAIELRVDLQIKLEKTKRRKAWDKTLLGLVIVGFLASYCMILLIGLGVLSFGNNSFAVPSVVAAGIIQTYGLAKIAAEYFFSDDRKRKTNS
jgi:hypothetical protein